MVVLTIPGLFEYFSENDALRKSVLLMKEQQLPLISLVLDVEITPGCPILIGG